jgi:hypothetical protein
MSRSQAVDPLDEVPDCVCCWLKGRLTVYLVFLVLVIWQLIDFEMRSSNLSRDHACLNVESAATNVSEIRMRLKRKITPCNPLHLSGYFGFWTTTFDLTLLMPPKSAHKARMDDLTLIFEFALPFIANSPGDLFCANTSNPFRRPSNFRYITQASLFHTIPRLRR